MGGEEVLKIEVTESSFDFREVEYKDVVDHQFVVKNVGSKDLKITKVATSCGCTEAKVESETISPSGETALNVTYDTGKMSGAHAKGDQERN